MANHGTRACYLAGCRESACVTAHKRYCKQYRMRKVNQGGTVMADGERLSAHIKDLRLTMSLGAIAAAAGTHSSHIYRIQSGETKTVSKDLAARILAVHRDSPTGSKWVNALGARRRLHSLVAMGYSFGRIERELADYSRKGLYAVAHKKRLWITSDVDQQIRDTWDRLHMTLPVAANKHEAAGITKAIATAQRNGWVKPMAWEPDTIDDPRVKPQGYGKQGGRGADDYDEAVVIRILSLEPIRATAAEKHEAVRRWVASGRSARQLALAHGWNDGRYGKGRDAA